MEGHDNVGDMKGDAQQPQQEQLGEGSVSCIVSDQSKWEVQEENTEEQPAEEQVNQEQQAEEQVNQEHQAEEQETEVVQVKEEVEVKDQVHNKEEVNQADQEVEEQTSEGKEVAEQVDEREEVEEVDQGEELIEEVDEGEEVEVIEESELDTEDLNQIEEDQEETEKEVNHNIKDVVEEEGKQKETEERYKNWERKEQAEQKQNIKQVIPAYSTEGINDAKQKWKALEKQEDQSEVDNNKNYKIKIGQKPKDIEREPNTARAMADATKTSRFGGTSEKCAQCNRTVYAMEKMEVAGRLMHKTCFRCCKCNSPLSVGRFSVGGGHLYCLTHYKQAFREKGTYDVFTPDNPCKGKWQPKAQE
ncbi:probable inactive protein kinase DDB_G0270444 [Homarus americanus]|uniref:LIM domain-containing protein PLIM2a-like n=1 Tax=Homarus americanus TaxID=6706 RepID=A0A8J5MRJ7_HOMAM|nr:probable inactive protein kinase DDB_G0270444 [Homarus americanus]KAG7160956.1 LIM domain-containing protein PLIM2a-like [Homarus americanus]